MSSVLHHVVRHLLRVAFLVHECKSVQAWRTCYEARAPCYNPVMTGIIKYKCCTRDYMIETASTLSPRLKSRLCIVQHRHS